MITSAQLRAARALLGLDQRALAERCGLSVPTIQRMEASEDVIRGNVDSLMKLVGALDEAAVGVPGQAGPEDVGEGRSAARSGLPAQHAADDDPLPHDVGSEEMTSRIRGSARIGHAGDTRLAPIRNTFVSDFCR